jgi:lysophospholipase L1-like esterase
MAAYATGAATAAGALTAGVLFGQAAIARMIIPGAEAPPPRSDGRYGDKYTGEPLRLALLGDSTAAGFGVRTRAETPGALLSGWVADAARRPVVLHCPAVVGATSAMLAPQVESALEHGLDVALILIGANDVTTRNRQTAAVRHVYEAVCQLRAAGATVVVGTCPDLGTVQPIHPPLRWLARRWSRQLAAAQTIAVVEAGGRTVSLGDLLGPEFAAAPDRMFADDRFHPSADGYALVAAAMFPGVLAALGLGRAEPQPSTVRSLPAAAVAAVARPGSEVSRARVAGHERGPRGRWAQLRQRIRPQQPPEAGTRGDEPDRYTDNGYPAGAKRDADTDTDAVPSLAEAHAPAVEGVTSTVDS